MAGERRGAVGGAWLVEGFIGLAKELRQFLMVSREPSKVSGNE